MAKILHDLMVFINGSAFGLLLVMSFAAVVIDGGMTRSLGWVITVCAVLFIVSGAVLMCAERKRK